MDDLAFARTLLFTPADRPDRFAKAASSGADGVILDLEDAVGLPHKDAARANVLDALAAPTVGPRGFTWAVRLNHVTTPAGLADLLALGAAATVPRIVVLPKTESVTEVDVAVAHLSRDGVAPTVIALLESGRGLSAAEAIAAHPAVAALAFGGVDLAADLCAELSWEPMLFARSRLVQAAATAQIPAIDVPSVEIHDSAALERETRAVKCLGLPANSPFTPRRYPSSKPCSRLRPTSCTKPDGSLPPPRPRAATPYSSTGR
jgi:citrate lyase beta subunit